MRTKVAITLAAILGIFCLNFWLTQAEALTVNDDPRIADRDADGLSDFQETEIYKTDASLADTDRDGYLDGEEVKFNYDPNKAGDDKLHKTISINLKDQSLTYGLGPYTIKTILVSTGDRKHPTPKGTYSILEKKPLVTYKGADYYYPNTKWNLKFKLSKAGNYYIHGAYWHDKFGTPVSHGCVNVAYADAEELYNWADQGTEIVIR